jgi:hypothetical protein
MRLAHAMAWLSVLLALAGCAKPKPASPPPPRPASPKSVPPPARPPSVISPQTNPEEERRLVQLTTTNLESAEQRLKQLGDRRLSAEQQDTAQTIQSFIVKAREALGANDLARASTLSDKARILADELARNVR